MTRNDDYWEPGLPYLDGASITGVPDDSVRLAMVRTAEAEIVVFVSPTDVPLVQDNPNLRVASGPGPTHVVVMNTQSPPFDNKALRQAIAYSFDRPEVIEAQFQGFGTPAQIPVIPADWAYDPNIRPYVRDLDKAKEKLSEAGYAGVEVPIFCMSTSAQIRMCEIFQAQFNEAGIKVKIERVLPSDYWSSWYSAYQGRRSTFGWWWWNWRPDPDIYLTRLYQTGGSWNVMDYSNPEVDRLLDQARAIYHTGDAKSLYSQILEIVMDDAPIVPFAYPDDFTVMTNKLGGFNWRADPGIRIREYWLEQ
jgi:peptide/nickel transport system substrate-binding protein